MSRSTHHHPTYNTLEQLFLDAIASRTRSKGVISFRGYTGITAPGFDAGTFAKAVDRALDEVVALSPTARPETFIATRPGSPRSYVVTPSSCSCPAGWLRKPCKHVALLTVLLTVTRPRAP